MKVAIYGVWHVHAGGYTRKAMEMGRMKSVVCTVRNLFFGVLKKIKYTEKAND